MYTKEDYIEYLIGNIRSNAGSAVMREYESKFGKPSKQERKAYHRSEEYLSKYYDILNQDEDYQMLVKGTLPKKYEEGFGVWVEKQEKKGSKKEKSKTSKTGSKKARRAEKMRQEKLQREERKRREEEIRKENQEKSKELREKYLGEESFKSFFEHYLSDHYQDLYDYAEETLIFSLTHGSVYVAVCKDSWGRTQCEEISNQTYDEFCYDLYSLPEYGYHVKEQISNIIGLMDDEDDLFWDYINEELPWTETLEECDEKEDINNIKCDRLMDVSLRVLNELAEKYSEDDIENIILQNPHYEKVAKEKKLKDEIPNTILTKMPDNYIDLYPRARSLNRHFVLHVGPTNSGKTHDAVKVFENCKHGVYLGPLRLLAYEQFDRMNKDGIRCSLRTGEEHQDVVGATVTASTIEMASFSDHYDVAVIDEAQMIEDIDRGGAWTATILGLPADKIMICCAPEARNRIVGLIESCGDTYEVVGHERMVPLEMESEVFQYPKDVKEGDALIVFSRRDVHAVASELSDRGMKCSIIYGALPYDVRHKQADLFASGKTDVVVSTDAIGLGMNLPIKRVVFLSTTKYNGRENVDLPASLVRQIAGRAGRFGIYDKGTVAVTNKHSLEQFSGFLRHKPKQIKEAVLAFPEALLSIDAPVSMLLEQWNKIMPKEGFRKTNIEVQIGLAKELEKISDDKPLIYDFVTIPFSEKSDFVHNIWKEMFVCEDAKHHYDVDGCLEEKVLPISDSESLESLELEYQICDLFYHYTDKFLIGEEKESLESKIIQTKNELSLQIMARLDEKKLKKRTCNECGRPLSWDYPYGMCQKCYRELQRARREYHRMQQWWYDDYDDDDFDYEEY